MENQEPYYYKIGVSVLLYWEGRWQKGQITNDYRTHDGIVHVQISNGKTISFGEARHKEYIKPV